jgi:hypothetical protein
VCVLPAVIAVSPSRAVSVNCAHTDDDVWFRLEEPPIGAAPEMPQGNTALHLSCDSARLWQLNNSARNEAYARAVQRALPASNSARQPSTNNGKKASSNGGHGASDAKVTYSSYSLAQ